MRPFRFVYPASGTNLFGSVLLGKEIIDTKAYWIAVTEEEGSYLAAIFNSKLFLESVASFQSVGEQGTRDFHRHVFRVPIPKFDLGNGFHKEIARWGLSVAKLPRVS